MVVKTEIELDSHSDTCVVGDHCLSVHDHKRSVNVYGYDPKSGSKHACLVDATVIYIEPKTGQVALLLINQVIEMKDLDHNILCPMNSQVYGTKSK